MKQCDTLIIGAGPAAFGALLGLGGRGPMSVFQLTGADHAALGADSWINGGLARPAVAAELGLPQVRAFGPGGTTRLWHGGLFVPHQDDAILSPRDGVGVATDLLSPLDAMLARCADQPGVLFTGLREVLARGRAAAPSGPLRQVYIPSVRRQLDARMFELAARGAGTYAADPGVVVDIVPANGRFDVLYARADGYAVVNAGRIVLAAGVLGSGILMRRLLGTSALPFSDHYHVFAGSVPSRLISGLTRKEAARGQGKFHHGVKFSVRLDNGDETDVMFTFRKVSNPDFPRSGRRFGKFIGINALSRFDKLKLIAANPLTGLEMLAFVWGMELPAEHCLVHATVAPRRMSGAILADGIAPNLPKEAVVVAIGKAWQAMCAALELSPAALTPFAPEQVRDSVISGAQFVGSLSAPRPAAATLLDQLVVADCSRFTFTSVYNQGLVSLAAGFLSVSKDF